MKRVCAVVVFAGAAFFGACSPKPAEVSREAQNEAASLASEADFAYQIREYKRAEDLFRRATEINPNFAGFWLQLGFTQRRQEDLKGAKASYEKALSLQKAAYKADKQPQHLLDQIEVLALLGREDAARKVLEKAVQDHPEHIGLKRFADQKVLDRMLADPGFKALVLN